jgi:uncharacterized membrane protein
MKLAYGEGALVAILAPFVVYLFGKINLPETFFLIFALLGVWTLVSAFAIVTAKEKFPFIAWGLVLASFSSAFITRIQYAVALIILAIIAAILINVATRKSQPRKNQVKADQNKPNPA